VDESVEIVDSPALLTLRPSGSQWHGGGATAARRVSMNGMDEVEVAQAQIVDVPSTFDGPVVLLDVREDDEWQRGHAPGAQHIPMGQVPSRIGEISADAKLFVVCQAGGRSQRVAQYLARSGYTPVNVSGGMSPCASGGRYPQAWAGAGRPVITDDGATGVI
jgi:rhodanese-related sulfurtransferase